LQVHLRRSPAVLATLAKRRLTGQRPVIQAMAAPMQAELVA
jgi:hypothetical protein